MKSKVLIFVFSFLFGISAFSQSYNSYFYQFDFKYHYGVSLPHHDYMNYIIKDRIMIGELNFSFKTDGSKTWQRVWRCPELGVAYQFGTLGNNKILGYSNSIFGFIGIPVIENDYIILKYRIGGGLAYLTKEFNVRSNPLNVAIGSHFNAHVHLSIIADIKPFDIPLYISPGFAFNHFSAGAITAPNLGINQFSVNLGIKYLYSEYQYSLLRGRKPYQSNPEWELSVYYSTAIKKNTVYSRLYSINSISADAGLRVSFKRTFGLGTSFSFDPSIKMLLEEQQKYNCVGDLFRLGFHVYQELYFTEKLSCLIHFGGYAYNKYYTNTFSWFYVKAGLRYTFKYDIFTGISLKTRNFAADNIEVSGGYRILKSEW